MQRSLVSYDDLVQPPEPLPPTQNEPGLLSSPSVRVPPLGPPKKKQRKQRQQQRRNQSQQNRQYAPQQNHQTSQPVHWDDPGAAEQSMTYESSMDASVYPKEEEEEGEMSRILTHEEIWDDSALIDAWESATAEYEAYHGKNKAWKTEPVKKSPLWYNVPPTPNNTTKEQETPPAKELNSSGGDDGNSRPFDFATFVPDHDPALTNPDAGVLSAQHPMSSFFDLGSAGSEWASKDQAFSRAMNAMYWTGYWTAVYHSHNSPTKPNRKRTRDMEGNDESEEYDEIDEQDDPEANDTIDSAQAQASAAVNVSNTADEEDDEFISTQR